MLSRISVCYSVKSYGRKAHMPKRRHRISPSYIWYLSGLIILIFLEWLSMNAITSSAASTPNPKKPFHLAEHVDYVSDITFSPDGKLFAVLGTWNNEGRLMFFAYPNGRIYRIMKIPYDHLVGTLAFSRDGKHIAVACYSTLQVWDVTNGRLLMNDEKAHWNRVHSLHFLQDGKTLITAGRDNEVKIWNVPEGKLRANFRLPIGIGSWRPDDDEPGIKPRPRPPLVVELKVPKGCLDRMILLSDGKTVAVATGDKKVYLWDLRSGKNLRTLKTVFPTGVSELALSPDGRLLATGGDGTLRLSNLIDCSKPLTVLRKHKAASTQRIRFTADGKRLMAEGIGSNGQGSVTVWDLSIGEELFTIEGEGEINQEDILCCTITPEGKLVTVFGAFEKPPRLRFWDLATGKELPMSKK